MLEDIEFDHAVRMTIYNLMRVLYECGISEINVGGVMRIMGIPNDKACLHDDTILVIDEKFVKYVEELNEPRPADQTLH